MPESVTRPDADRERSKQDCAEPSEALPVKEKSPADEGQMEATPGEKDQEAQQQPAEKIIWTPAFLLTFALTLVLGLSADSLFTQGWYSHLFGGQWIILAQVILATLGWLGLGIVTRSRWIRLGCIFGGIWAGFMVLNIFTYLAGIDSGAPVQSYINVATCMALLGAYIGLSIEGTLLTSWDTWLFFLVPILGAIGVTLTYFLTPQASILTVDNAIATAALIACCLFWWFRPSCWKKRPGPTFIFGLVPAILLAMALSNASMQSFFLLQVANPQAYPGANMNNFFFAQVILLCLLLGCMRIGKSEIFN
jgi:hypothetical protein